MRHSRQMPLIWVSEIMRSGRDILSNGLNSNPLKIGIRGSLSDDSNAGKFVNFTAYGDGICSGRGSFDVDGIKSSSLLEVIKAGLFFTSLLRLSLLTALWI